MTVIDPGSADEVEASQLPEERARELVDRITDQLGRAVEKAAELQQEQEDLDVLITLAYKGRAWVPLGYANWEEMCRAEFDAARVLKPVGERRERVQALIAEGLSTRAVGAVLGVGNATVFRDARALATVSDETVANGGPGGAAGAHAPAASDRDAAGATLQGLDGRERPRRRATTKEQAERAVHVAKRRAQGWTQADIGEELGVTQRTVSNYDSLMRGWAADLSTKDTRRLEAGEMPLEELAERADLEIVETKGRRLDAASRNGARSLTDTLRFVSESVVFSDAWLEERAAASAVLAPALAQVAGEAGEWMALELTFTDVPDDELQLLSDDLGRASEWAYQARRRLLKAAAERGVELDEDRYRGAIEQKVRARQGRVA